MKTLLISLLLSLSLFGETLEEYKADVIYDAKIFKMATSQYLPSQVTKDIDKLMEAIKYAKYTEDVDYFTLIYLVYKQDIIDELQQ